MSDDDRQYPGPFKREDPQYMEALREKDAEIKALENRVYTMQHTSGSWRCDVAERLERALAEVKRLKAEAAQRPQGPNPIIQRVANVMWQHAGDPEKSARTRYQLIAHDIASFLTCLSEDVNENASTALASMTAMTDALQTYEWLTPVTRAGLREMEEDIAARQRQLNTMTADLEGAKIKLDKDRLDFCKLRKRVGDDS